MHCLPPGAKIQKDFPNNRWRAHYEGHSISRSWVVRTSAECVTEVLQFLWRLHKDLTGEPCPVTGIF